MNGVVAGGYALVRYNVPGVVIFHERYVTAVRGCWVTWLTPDQEHYGEELHSSNQDLVSWQGLVRAGDVPVGVDATTIHRFRPALSTAQRRTAVAAAGEVALRDFPLGGATLAPTAMVQAEEGFIWVQWLDGDSLDFGEEVSLATVTASSRLDNEMVARGPGGMVLHLHRVPREDRVGLVEGERQRRRAARVGGGSLAAAKAAMVAATKDGEGDGVPPQVHIDSRILPIRRDGAGERYREVSSTVQDFVIEEYADWPVVGPRVAQWTLRDLTKGGASPTTYYSKFRTELLMTVKGNDLEAIKSSELLSEMKFLMEVLESMVMYDQLVVTNLSSGELLLRRVQQIRYAFALKPNKPKLEDDHLLLATSTSSQCGLAPALAEYMSEKKKTEQKLLKERRLLEEENKSKK
jgi:hypothetical protein